MIKQSKVYIKSLGMILPVEVINYHEKIVEVYFNDNADNVPYKFNEVEFIYGTGFIDKNGKEIEHGDILKTEFEDVFSIKFNNVYGFYAIKDDVRRYFAEEDLDYELRETLSKTEVIGNIYENKDLLEVR
ncbi:YopX family protein [Gemella haemolysans]|uniref:YopX family protein n=1 Tax=Gemella haemolysans TaxID=1379 RepID=UPI00232CA246|nr:YopX family protein [Gemella haemolysans]MDB6212529.1 YopX family protein [Gemella haemolysans]